MQCKNEKVYLFLSCTIEPDVLCAQKTSLLWNNPLFQFSCIQFPTRRIIDKKRKRVHKQEISIARETNLANSPRVYILNLTCGTGKKYTILPYIKHPFCCIYTHNYVVYIWIGALWRKSTRRVYLYVSLRRKSFGRAHTVTHSTVAIGLYAIARPCGKTFVTTKYVTPHRRSAYLFLPCCGPTKNSSHSQCRNFEQYISGARVINKSCAFLHKEFRNQHIFP